MGNYQGYGMINGDGTVVDKNYWPYWLLRDASGNQVAAKVTVNPNGSAVGSTQDVLGTAAPDGSQVNIVQFTCTDDLSGVASCPAPVTVASEGADQTVTGAAYDAAGNVGSVTVTGINIDLTPPTVTFTGADTYTVDQAVYVNCTAADALSGLASDPCGGALVAAPAYSLGLGSHTVTVTEADRAGNAVTASATYTVQVTFDSLVNLTEQFVTKPGVAHSLVVKLQAAQAAAARGDTAAEQGSLEAYQNEVSAQSGKALTPDQASVLQSLARALL